MAALSVADSEKPGEEQAIYEIEPQKVQRATQAAATLSRRSGPESAQD